jgi:hypothetical protein
MLSPAGHASPARNLAATIDGFSDELLLAFPGPVQKIT